MLIVETIIKESKGRGVGLFAAQAIKRGTVVYFDDFRFDREFKESFINKLGKEYNAFKKFLEIHATYNEKKKHYHLAIDNFQFTNHSYNPNIKWNGEKSWKYIAIRDIKKGEEITCNYKDFETHLNFKVK